jgi:hypothetical protein
MASSDRAIEENRHLIYLNNIFIALCKLKQPRNREKIPNDPAGILINNFFLFFF